MYFLCITLILFSLNIVDADYPLHENISTTIFWVGEPGDSSNDDISNTMSAWDENWEADYGGVDDPVHRNGPYPAEFIPKMNPFYFALPYNDLNNNGYRKADAYMIIPWANESQYINVPNDVSILRGRFIRIIIGDMVAYAEWQDVGPFGEDDSAYVFGSATPSNPINDYAGLDVSPAVANFFGFLQDGDGSSVASWQFVELDEVPPEFNPLVSGYNNNNQGSGLSGGAIAGIFFVVLFVVIVAGLVGAVVFLKYRRPETYDNLKSKTYDNLKSKIKTKFGK